MEPTDLDVDSLELIAIMTDGEADRWAKKVRARSGFARGKTYRRKEKVEGFVWEVLNQAKIDVEARKAEYRNRR